MKHIFVVLFTLLFSSVVFAHTTNLLTNIEYVKNYDGDTITVNIPYWPPIVGNEMSIRVKRGRYC